MAEFKMLTDEELSAVVGGRTIPETIGLIDNFNAYLSPPANATEIDAINKIKDSLCTQGIKAAKSLSKRLARDNPRLEAIIDMIPYH